MTTAIDYLDNWQNYDKESLINRIKEVNESNEGHIFTKGLANVMHNKFEKHEVTGKIKLLLTICEIIKGLENKKNIFRCIYNVLMENLWFLVESKNFTKVTQNKLSEYENDPSNKDVVEGFKIIHNPTEYLINLAKEDDYILICSSFRNEDTRYYLKSDIVDYTCLFNTLESFDHKNASIYFLLGYMYDNGKGVQSNPEIGRNLLKKSVELNNFYLPELAESYERFNLGKAQKLYEKAIISGYKYAVTRLKKTLERSDFLEDYLYERISENNNLKLKIQDLKEKKKCLKYSPGNYGALMAENNFYELVSFQH